MTKGCNIFHDKTSQIGTVHNELDEVDDITRTRQVTGSKAGALASTSVLPEGMGVVNLNRPRRGHDY